MNTAMIGLLAETPIHPGAGSDTGFVDLPVAREAATDYPVIVGSSVKGALRDLARSHWGPEDARLDAVFGKQDGAGDLIVADARLLLLPVRSMTGHYRWITCPHLLERHIRDRERAGLPVATESQPLVVERGCYHGDGPEQLFLEERQFKHAADLPDDLIAAISPLVRHEQTRQRLAKQVVLLADDDFAWFARFGLSVNARNVLDKVTKTSTNLWYEETVPPDALFYLLLAERQQAADNDGAIARVLRLFEDAPYLQVGGNMTVGQGFLAIQPFEDQKATT